MGTGTLEYNQDENNAEAGSKHAEVLCRDLFDLCELYNFDEPNPLYCGGPKMRGKYRGWRNSDDVSLKFVSGIACSYTPTTTAKSTYLGWYPMKKMTLELRPIRVGLSIFKALVEADGAWHPQIADARRVFRSLSILDRPFTSLALWWIETGQYNSRWPQ
jgi:hypothetical protein